MKDGALALGIFLGICICGAVGLADGYWELNALKDIGFLGAIFGALVGGGVSVVATSHFTSVQFQREEKLDLLHRGQVLTIVQLKLFNLASACGAVSTEFGKYYTDACSVDLVERISAIRLASGTLKQESLTSEDLATLFPYLSMEKRVQLLQANQDSKALLQGVSEILDARATLFNDFGVSIDSVQITSAIFTLQSGGEAENSESRFERLDEFFRTSFNKAKTVEADLVEIFIDISEGVRSSGVSSDFLNVAPVSTRQA